jgi:hypothetical protein
VTTVVWIGAKFRTRDIWNMIQEFWSLRRKAQCLSEYWVQLTLRNKLNCGWEKYFRRCGDGQHVQIWGEMSEREGGEILVAAAEDIPALTTSTSEFGAHAPFFRSIAGDVYGLKVTRKWKIGFSVSLACSYKFFRPKCTKAFLHILGLWPRLVRLAWLAAKWKNDSVAARASAFTCQYHSTIASYSFTIHISDEMHC